MVPVLYHTARAVHERAVRHLVARRAHLRRVEGREHLEVALPLRGDGHLRARLAVEPDERERASVALHVLERRLDAHREREAVHAGVPRAHDLGLHGLREAQPERPE